MMAEQLKGQLSEPLEKAIKSMQVSRQTLQEETTMLTRELRDAECAWKRAREAAEESDAAANRAKQDLATVIGNTSARPKAIDAAKLAYQRASERASLARNASRQGEERLANVRAKHASTEIPRLLQAFRRQTSQRAYDAFRALHALGEVQRQTSELDVRAASEMQDRVSRVALSDDMDRFDVVYQTLPNVSPVLISIGTTESMTAALDLKP